MGQKLASLCVLVVALGSTATATPPSYKVDFVRKVATASSTSSVQVNQFNSAGEICFAGRDSGGEIRFGGVVTTDMYTDVTGRFGYPSGYAGTVFKNTEGTYAIRGRNWFNNFFRTIDSSGEAVPIYGLYDLYDVRGLTDTGWVWGSSAIYDHNPDYESAHAYNIHTKKSIVDTFSTGNSHIEGMANSGSFIALVGTELWFDDERRNGYLYENGKFAHLPWPLTQVRFNNLGQYVGYHTSFESSTGHRYSDVVLGKSTAGQTIIEGAYPTGLGDDGRIGFVDELTNAQMLWKDGVRYDFHAITEGLAPDMALSSVILRANGDVAAVGKQGDNWYVLRMTAVPEPSVLLALAGGLCALMRRRPSAN